MSKPKPTSFRPPINMENFNVEKHRNVHCSSYKECLNITLKKDWPSFTCVKCPLEKRDQAPSASMMARDQPRGIQRMHE